ncbi:cytochrome P450 [Gloeophyllum trabeum ATCC 11539]|uniref:Cytochrome P450 n=1 Tax=Gloeophyllum trabeum (strain ATCC 11539 / FP-39264 / Madison 617) TaxID=670483 RepID=S7RF58_GLOTA|nr:cytochrome P450 [Gloeophyllum trabeum ATCC 11539]EPQ52860.1 cytochrome P450 [Gloeophyllum trabeum ATCC 11539]
MSRESKCMRIILILVVLSVPRASIEINQDNASFLWGHEWDVFSNSVGSKFTEWFNKHGPVYRMKGALLHPDMLVVADPAAINRIMVTNSYNYVKAPFFSPVVERLLGRGIIWSEGSLHKRFRRLMEGTFSPSKIREMSPNVFEATSSLQTRLVQHLQDNHGQASIDVLSWASSATLDVIGRVGFGYDFRGGESEEAKDIKEGWAEQVIAGMSPTAFYGEVILRAFPILHSLPVKSMQAQGRMKVTMDKLARRLIASSERNPEKAQGKGVNFLATMVNASGEGKMTTQETIDNVSHLVTAGYETSAMTSSMILWELAKQPSCQQKLREELVKLGREPTYDDLISGAELPYLDAVVKEGYVNGSISSNSAANYGRVALADDVLPLETPIITPSGKEIRELRIRAGQSINLPHISINTLDSIWGDGQVFRPERWTDPRGLPLKAKGLSSWSNLMTFGAGPRMCLGYRLAFLELKAIIATLIRTFKFELTGEHVEKRYAVVLQPRVVGKEQEGPQLPLNVTFAA